MRKSLIFRCPVILNFLFLSIVCGSTGWAAVYEVGPGRIENIGEVPWESLSAGDTVLIHWRQNPYREKWVIARQGTVAEPIKVSGVAGPNGELPVISGDGATTRLDLDYWNEDRSVIKIGGASVPPDDMPQYIIIENLDVQSARPPYTFTADNGSQGSYRDNAAAIHVEKGEHITVRNCLLHDCGNGFFVSSSQQTASRDILVEGCYIYDNGIDGSIYHHNNYTAAAGITFQYNRFGPLRTNCLGNNLKDRSAGLVVRYNWIEGGNRQLDLVDAEDSDLLLNDPSYRQTHVYGNVLVETEGSGNRQVIHYGGDSGTETDYRKGTLYLYNNTVVSTRTDRTTLVRLSSPDETCDARNNIVYTQAAGGDTLSLLVRDGVLNWSHNWTKPGWVVSFETFLGVLNDDGTSISGVDPGFLDEPAQDFRLAAGSACLDRGTTLEPAVLPDHDVLREYVTHQAGRDRYRDSTLDIGAYECAAANPPGPVTGLRFAADKTTFVWEGVDGSLSYDVVKGDLMALRAAGGDFSTSITTCLLGDGAVTQATDPDVPPPGGAFYYLVRASNCNPDPGTYDSRNTTPPYSRDPSIQGSPNACP
ncbi:polysaccharide-degrading enzyme [Acidobacteriota bacterium]